MRAISADYVSGVDPYGIIDPNAHGMGAGTPQAFG